MVPREGQAFASWLEWCFFIATELDATSLYVMRRHRDLKHIYGDTPDAVKSAGEYFRTQLRYVNVALSDGRRYLLGGQFTSADILLTTCLSWAVDYGVDVCQSGLDYLGRTMAREAYQRALAANRPT